MKTFAAALAVWMILATAQASVMLAFGSGKNHDAMQMVALYSAVALTWVAITVVVQKLSRRLDRLPQRGVRIVAHIVAVIAAAVLDAIVRRMVGDLLMGGNIVSFPRTLLYFADINALSYVLALWLGKAIEARAALVAQTRHELALRAQLARARLGYLQAQLQPHFLFNALGAVTELIFEDPAAAVRTFRQLGLILKSSSYDAGEIRLQDEVAGLMPYLDVQRTRFSDWLTISLDVDPDAHDLLMPPLVLQPLVENSIRHGLKGRHAAGAISIRAEIIEGLLTLTVRDNGVGFDQTARMHGRGVGLSNTAERLVTLYGADASLRLFQDAAGGTVAKVCLPARAAPRPPVSEPNTGYGGALLLPARASLVRRHPVIALVIGCVLTTVLWAQHSYAYLVMSGRLNNTTFATLIHEAFFAVLLWFAMVPIIVWTARRIPIATGKPFINSALHTLLAFGLALLQSAGVVLLLGQDVSTSYAPTLRAYATISFLIYIAALAYSQRQLLEEWFAETQLAAMRTTAEIAESRVAAAALEVDMTSLDEAALQLERYVRDDPLRAEQVVADLGNRLRARLESTATPRKSTSLLPIAGEDRIERIAMSA